MLRTSNKMKIAAADTAVKMTFSPRPENMRQIGTNISRF
jgi:hypothetical protein